MEKLFKNSFTNMRKIATFGIVCTLLFAVISCNNNEPKDLVTPFGQLSLSESDRQVINENILRGSPNPWRGKVVIINSNEELKRYFNGTEGILPDIDFSRQTLLLTAGTTLDDIEKINVSSFQQLSTNRYKWGVEVFQSDFMMDGRWVAAYITKPLSSRSEIELSVTLFTYGWVEPAFGQLPLSESHRIWINQNILGNSLQNKVVIINSEEELKKYFNNVFPDNVYGSLPNIDFSRQTLLLAAGTTATVEWKVNVKSFQHLSANKYKWDIEVLLTFLTGPGMWVAAYITKPLSTQSEIELNVTTNCYW